MIKRVDASGKEIYYNPEDLVQNKGLLRIHGGECAICPSNKSYGISTLLGSCVSIMIHDEKLKMMAMNHFLLPSSLSKSDSLNFGYYSMEFMINELMHLGSIRLNLVAKVAGGANVLDKITIDTGEKNINFANDYLRKEGIRVLSRDVGGYYGRVIMMQKDFNTYVRYVQKGMSQIEQEDKRKMETLAAQKRKSSDVLFL